MNWAGMHNTYFTTRNNPSSLASLSGRQRSERATWRASLRPARSTRRRESIIPHRG